MVAQVIPLYLQAHSRIIIASAERHHVSAEWLTAVLYNEMLGTEDRLLRTLIPGDDGLSQTIRNALLGWHFLTIKQAQWAAKAGLALLGLDTTVGPTGIRVSVGREIQREEGVPVGSYRPYGLLERPTMVADLMRLDVAIDYLAANMARGQRRAGLLETDDWSAAARWHNTGLVGNEPSAPRPIWDKGTRYVEYVRGYLSVAAKIVPAEGELSPPKSVAPILLMHFSPLANIIFPLRQMAGAPW